MRRGTEALQGTVDKAMESTEQQGEGLRHVLKTDRQDFTRRTPRAAVTLSHTAHG